MIISTKTPRSKRNILKILEHYYFIVIFYNFFKILSYKTKIRYILDKRQNVSKTYLNYNLVVKKYNFL